MPIEVHCPSPACARVHQVKNKYAGTRGKCPVCQSWMYVPKAGLMPSLPSMELPPAVSIPALDESPPWPREQPAARAEPAARKPAPRTLVAQAPAIEEEEAPIYEEPPPRPRKQRAPVVVEEEEAVIEEVIDDEIAVEVEDEPVKKKPQRHFSWLAVAFLILANLGVAAFVAAPWLPGPAMQKSGAFVKLPNPTGIDSDGIPVVACLAGFVALCGLTSLLLALISRRMGVATLVPLYVATIGAAALVMLSFEWLRKDLAFYREVVLLVNDLKAKGEPGDATPTFGVQHYVMAGGAATAAVGLVFAGTFMHRRLWSRLLGFVALSFLPALAATWIYRKELGLTVELPFKLPW